MPSIGVRLLGEPALVVDGRAVTIGPAKQQALLVALALHRGSIVSADRLVCALWGASPPPTAGATLRTLVSRLRRLGLDAPWIAGRGAGYALELAAGCIDAERFGELAAAGREAQGAGDPVAACASFTRALACWSGPAFGRIAELDFARAAATGLDDARLDALEGLAEAELDLGRPGDALVLIESHVGANPLRERACGQLMRALYGVGRQADALAVYQRLRERLAAELGIDPSRELRELEVGILRQDVVSSAGSPPSVRPPPVVLPVDDVRIVGIPAALSAFVGRHDEVANVMRALEKSRLVSLVGPGGAGKTRLAFEAVPRVAARHPDGVWGVDLTPLRDPEPERIALTIAAAIALDTGAMAATGMPFLDALCDRLRHRRMLVVLDNCEHVIDGAATVTHAILAGCPEVTILATSREVLCVPGEAVLRVWGMSLPPPDAESAQALCGAEAVALFAARAAESTPGFAVHDENAPAVARICRRLDGLPLALELAAARLRVLDVGQIADRLDDRFRLLSAGPRTVDARHRTLEGAIDWSHGLLPEPERIALRRLSVFPASWTLSAAEAVIGDGGDAFELVASLADKSLVLPLSAEGEGRYRLLETIRQYAADRLFAAGEVDATRARHGEFYARAVRGWTEPSHDLRWLCWVDAEIDNLRFALSRSAELGDHRALLSLASPLWVYWLHAGQAEALTWLEQAITAPHEGSIGLAVQARIGLSFLVRNVHGDTVRAEALLAEAIDLAAKHGQDERAAHARYHAADLAMSRGRRDEAQAVLDDVLDYYARSGLRPWSVWPLALRAWPSIACGDWPRARHHLSMAQEVLAEFPNAYGEAHLRGMLALVEAAAGDTTTAGAEAVAAVVAARRFPTNQVLAMALLRSAEAAALAADLGLAAAHLVELLRLLRELGARRWVAEALEMAAVVLAPERPEAAACCLGAAAELRSAMDETEGRLPVTADLVAAAEEQVDARLGGVSAAARARGAALHLTELLAFARSELVALLAPAGR